MSETIPVKLLFSDGVMHTIDASPGQTLVEAAAGAGLGLLTDCSNGQCGTCVAQCVFGEVELGDYDKAVLPDGDRADGSILCCVAHVRAPAVIELPYDASEACAEEAPPQQGYVHSIETVAEEVVRLVIQVNEPVQFLPGQYVRLRPQGVTGWRSYSMANSTGEKQLEFFVRVVDGVAFSQWLTTQAVLGMGVDVGTPRGSFFLRDEPRPRLFVAGGTGLAPFLAMLRKLSASTPVANTPPTRLLVGARSGAHLFAQEEIRAVQRTIPNLHVTLACESIAPDGSHLGYATDLITPGSLLPGTRVYLCGPPPMVDAARVAVLKAGARKNDVLCERFN